MLRIKKYIALVIIFIIPFYSYAELKIIDADTIKLHDIIVRLSGIDAPEKSQKCQKYDDTLYNCGIHATNELKKLFKNNLEKEFYCEYNNRDKYNRYVGECYIGSINVNRWLVKNGWALAYRKYSHKYIEEEQIAKLNKAGIWSGKFIEPWKWRRTEKLISKPIMPKNNCMIKGNISSNDEKIYHMKEGQYYSKTKISPTKGEKWFCTEKQAIDNGWRKSEK